MQVLVIPSTAWPASAGTTGAQAANAVAQQVARAWSHAVPSADVQPVLLSDGSAGFAETARSHLAEPTADDAALFLETAAVAAGETVAARSRASDASADAVAEHGSSAPVGELLVAALETSARTIVLGAGDALGGDTAWADGGAGMLATLAERLGVPGGSARLTGGAGALAGVDASDLPDLLAVRRALAGRDVVVAQRGDRTLLGLGGLAAGLSRHGVSAATTQRLERSLGDLALAVGRARSGSLVGRELLGASVDVATTSPDHLARSLASTAGAAAGGGVAFMLAALGARVQRAIDVVADLAHLREKVAASDLVVVVAPAIDAAEVHDGVLPTVAQVALDHAVPVAALVGGSEAGRREWSAIGVAGVHETGREDVAWWTHGDEVAERVGRVARTWVL
ncbi:glycerate kinase [Flavimobilis soli]|uniref:Glycerate kinase n=1 Tax=Flavimobilis soli TaxID=442709 RepID=A0A2A9EB61_9MICO|nr:glycerate kinase [Flavimobilis soli]PFG35450.1 glycerate kinase [Flavimobilis soli]